MNLKLITKARKGNRIARTALIESLVPVATFEAAKWRKIGEDGKGIALLALTEAVDAALLSHDSRQSGITAYVRKSVRRALSHAHNTRHAVHAPLDMQGQLRAVRAGHPIPERTRRTLSLSMPRALFSLDAPASRCDDGEPRTIGDLIADPQAESSERLATDAERRARLKQMLLSAIDSSRDRLVLTLLFGLDTEEPLEQSAVAAMTALTVPQIAGIRSAALKKWRQTPQLHDLLQRLVTHERQHSALR